MTQKTKRETEDQKHEKLECKRRCDFKQPQLPYYLLSKAAILLSCALLEPLSFAAAGHLWVSTASGRLADASCQTVQIGLCRLQVRTRQGAPSLGV